MTEAYDWQQQAQTYRIRGEYDRAATLYEEAIAAEPSVASHYWYLGLVRLLQGEEAEAQFVWMTPLLEAEPEQQEAATTELVQILQVEASRLEAISAYQPAWLIRQHIREIDSQNCHNLLHIIQLEIELQRWETCSTTLSDFTQVLADSNIWADLDSELLSKTLERVLESAIYLPETVAFAEACIVRIPQSQSLLPRLLDRAIELHHAGYSQLAVSLCKICLQIEPENFNGLYSIATFLQDLDRISESLVYAQDGIDASLNLPDKIAATYLRVRGLMQSGGEWEEAARSHQEYQRLLLELVHAQPQTPIASLLKVITAGVTFSYFSDNPDTNHRIRYKIANFIQSKLQASLNQKTVNYQTNNRFRSHTQKSPPLKVGYLSECLREHSVGWLARWLLKYHDPNAVEVHLYSSRQTGDGLQHELATAFGDRFHAVPYSLDLAADRINQDDIDLLIDLDSLTSNHGCGVMALKPAPVQVTWLGFDAAGFSNIDYFLADPYVLPEEAPEYYTETIWRLPTTYIAVDGFEVGVPTLRRDRLGIPSDAVIYFCSQTGYKRHPDNVRLQMQILREVPNSYFLIKGLNTDSESLKRFVRQIGEEEGVSCDRLRFLDRVPSSQIHRANLGIADVILDTYPYNGTTTTLEALWMGLPVVTRVGKQFSSRQGYTLLRNAGVSEGIARTDEEYLEWGIRMGCDPTLRQQIFCQLQAAKKTSPLWNARQFTRDVENAYRQMWIKQREYNPS